MLAGNAHTVLLDKDGKVYGCGYNGYGQLADGSKTARRRIVQSKYDTGDFINNAKDINARHNTSAVVSKDGGAWVVRIQPKRSIWKWNKNKHFLLY